MGRVIPIRPYQANMYIRCRPERLAILWKLVRPSTESVLFATKLDEIQLSKIVTRDFLGARSAKLIQKVCYSSP
jgi:hypothetical protein